MHKSHQSGILVKCAAIQRYVFYPERRKELVRSNAKLIDFVQQAVPAYL
jgi:hypothetical protein